MNMVNAELTEPQASPPSARRTLLLRRKAQIENQLLAMDARAKLADRRRDTRRKIIVGAAVMAHARLDPIFAQNLQDVLARAVKREGDRAIIADQIGSKLPIT